ncbi:MAG: NAD(P)H:quinone oxidoreductase [Candidatus Omnitrophica bacterium]|nr:NAD(P)H:quinone oxidoreductase [Candidatus Omnitrophota bacterium]
MKPKIGVVYYSMSGNTFRMAQAVCQGIEEVDGQAILRTVPELLPKEIIESDERIKKAKEAQKEVAVVKVEELAEFDGIILGSPTRFGNMCSQLRNFLDQTGGLWLKGVLINKPAGVFCCTASLHGGQETTLISMMFTLLHHGALIVGVPYSIKELIETRSGGTPYGPTAVVGTMAEQPPRKIDLKIARELGKRVTRIAQKLIN